MRAERRLPAGLTEIVGGDTIAVAAVRAHDGASPAAAETAHGVVRVGVAAILGSAGLDTALALQAGRPPRTVCEGIALMAIATAGVVYPGRAARVLRPAGRMTAIAAAFAVAGLVDRGVQADYAQVAPTLVLLSALLDSRRWVLATLVVSFGGYLAGMAPRLDGELVATQAGNLALSATSGMLAVTILLRSLASAPAELAAVRDGAPSLTPALGAAVRRAAVAQLPRADPHGLVERLTDAEHTVVRQLEAGRAPKQVAADLGVSMATVRSHIAAAKRKTGARTVGQLVALHAGVARDG